MKFFISKENLQYAIQNVQRAISARSPLPVLTGILFKCDDGVLKLTATDMDISIMSSVPVEVEKSGGIIIPAKYISEFAKKLPDKTIEFESISEGQMVTVRYGQSEFTVNGFNPEDFPQMKVTEEEFRFVISSDIFKEIIKKVIYAVSHDDSRPIFTGVLLEIDGEEAVMVSTDTFRLAFKKFKINSSSSEIINTVIPGKALNEVLRIMGGNEDINVILYKNHIVFETEDKKIISRLIPGKFPSYRQVIPTNFNCIIKAPVNELLEAADRASLLAGEKNSLVMFKSTEEGVLISVRAESGWIREDVPAKVEGDKYDILFNVRYLWDAIKAHDGEEIIIKLTGNYTPALLESSQDEGHISIIVPARSRE